jgi:tRNA pseudouridine38-40 synthase
LNNYKIVLSYKGTDFSGSQYQKNRRTVAGEIKSALKKLYGDELSITLSGRTDAGVHAMGQVVNYRCEREIDENKILKAMNAFVGSDIEISRVEKVDIDFNARRNAISREYRYLFSNEKIPMYMKDYITYFKGEVNEKVFEVIGNIIKGENDFRKFRKISSSETGTIRRVSEFSINKKVIKDIYNYDFKYFELRIVGNSFLYRMVRNIVGAIFEIFKNKKNINDFKMLFDKAIDKYYYVAAPAKGLSLISVNY